MSSPSVRIRMYRQGLGDCFLLTFPGQNGDFHMLIDCGVISGTQDAAQWMNKVVQDIYDTTNHHLNLVVATHEHWDHLSDFNQARALFDQIQIDNIWLGWTEDPNNNVAKGLRTDRAARLSALRAGMKLMLQTGFNKDYVDQIHDVLAFFGDDPVPDDGLGVAAPPANGVPPVGTRTTSDALNYLNAREDARKHYCYPTTDAPLPLDGVDNVRAYVFGPPENLTLLKMSDPTKKGHETYGITALDPQDTFLAAIDPQGNPDLQEQSSPFEAFYRVKYEDAQKSRDADFFNALYGFDPNGPLGWRRIDTDWLNLTSELALNLDSDTNNTSLVLAIEIGDPGSGKVLLFPADAQVGNWESWGTLAWPHRDGEQAGPKITSADLLSRVVFYKVGHHGSHNATLSAQGLELMTSQDLVAMVPVNQKMATAKGWTMPLPALRDRLKEKTRGRTILMDEGKPTALALPNLSGVELKAFNDAVEQTDLYIQISI